MSASDTIRKANLQVTPAFVMARLQRSVPPGEIPASARFVPGPVTWDLFAIPGVEEFVERAYWLVLRRAPDAAGREEYCHHLSNGSCTRFEMVNVLRNSAEGRYWRTRIDGVGLRLRLLSARWARLQPKRIRAGLRRRLDQALRRRNG